jgi:hypothetical protein
MADEQQPDREDVREQSEDEVEDLELEEIDTDSVKGGRTLGQLPFTG